MDNDAKIKFLERIIPLSKFFTTPYISEGTSKLLWTLTILHFLFILLFLKIIEIKEITLLIFNIELSVFYLLIFISLSAFIVFVKIIFNYWSDITNWHYEFELNTQKFARLRQDIELNRQSLLIETDSLYNEAFSRHGKLSYQFTKSQQALSQHGNLENPSAQEKNIKEFFDIKYNFILTLLKKANVKHEQQIKENRQASENLSDNLEKLYKVVKSIKKQRRITFVSNFLLPLTSFIYIIFMLFTSK
ncbi:hypothetical protein [Enterobacter cloacae]|uniref:hypothetical protein n=1 Tax=Enterobacter cloacae TaxID=550 RepID=UPI002FF687EF